MSLFEKRTPVASRLTVEVNCIEADSLPPKVGVARPRSIFEEEVRDPSFDSGNEEEDSEIMSDDIQPPPKLRGRECQIPRSLAAQIPAGCPSN
jgi:hypothetical protein